MDDLATAQTIRVERIQSGTLHAEIAPAAGGSLAALYSELDSGVRRQWMRPATQAALDAREPLGMASFPLVPWCNRIRDSRFEFEGRQHRIRPNYGKSPHAIHGVGWHRAWEITDHARSSLSLRLEHAPSEAWPFAFVATQRYELDDAGLTIFITVENSGETCMPAGIGHHPYFPHRREGGGTTVQSQVLKIWQGDAEVMPTGLAADHAVVTGLRHGLPLSELDLDNNFTGYEGEAEVSWPDGSSLTMSSQSPLDFFVLFCPQGGDLFCMEAVSNCTDWINLRGDHSAAEVGGTVLAPGEKLGARIRFAPSFG